MNKLKALGFALLMLFVYLFAAIITVLLFGLYYSIMHGVKLHSIEQLLYQNAAMLTALAAFIAVLLIWMGFLITGKSIVKTCRFVKTAPTNLLLALCMGIGMALFFIAIMSLLKLDQFFPGHQQLMRLLMHEPDFTVSLLTIGLLIPFFEEIFYRGIIFNRLRRDFPILAALLLQAFLFGLIHFNPLQSSYAFLGSILIGLSYYYAGSIWVPILIHIGWNSTSVILSTFLEITPGTAAYTAMLLTGLVLIVVCLRYYKRSTTLGAEEE